MKKELERVRKKRREIYTLGLKIEATGAIESLKWVLDLIKKLENANNKEE